LVSVPKAGALAKASDWTTVFPTDTDAWLTYTPAWTASGTAPVLGNGSLVGAYGKVGRNINFRAYLTIGSTTTFGTGSYFLSLPIACVFGGTTPVGNATIVDVSAGTRFGRRGVLQTTTTCTFESEAGVVTSNLAPMTWATGDILAWSGTYESVT
jgi:hypothetical protein